MAPLVWLLYAVAGGIRLWFSASSLSSCLKNSVEVSTPLNSWKRVVEGIYLSKHGINPYNGSLFHETPITLYVFKFLYENWSNILPVLFMICDLATSFCLFITAKHFGKNLLLNQSKNLKEYASDASPLLIHELDVLRLPHYVAWMYLFNPYTIVNCIAMTTTVFSNLLLALTVMTAIKGNRLLCTCNLALATYQSLYPVILLAPVTLLITKRETCNLKANYNMRSTWLSILKTCVLFAFWISLLFYISFKIAGDWKFLSSVYGFILMETDLSPNIGLFWYFFTEMFDHFYLFFICTFQINIFIYVLPLSIKLRHEPVLLYFILCLLMATFKSYPSIGDVAFYLAFLPFWKHLYRYMRQSFVIGGFFLACSVLGPITRYLWLYSGSANANFYFAITLAFATGQIFLATDILFAHTKREFHLYKGVTVTHNGEPAKIILS